MKTIERKLFAVRSAFLFLSSFFSFPFFLFYITLSSRQTSGPPTFIRITEIKRRINVSRADGPNVRENPILACRAARLVRVSTLFFHHPCTNLFLAPRLAAPRFTALLFSRLSYFLFHSALYRLFPRTKNAVTHSSIHRNCPSTIRPHYHILIKILVPFGLRFSFLSLSLFSLLNEASLPPLDFRPVNRLTAEDGRQRADFVRGQHSIRI